MEVELAVEIEWIGPQISTYFYIAIVEISGNSLPSMHHFYLFLVCFYLFLLEHLDREQNSSLSPSSEWHVSVAASGSWQVVEISRNDPIPLISVSSRSEVIIIGLVEMK